MKTEFELRVMNANFDILSQNAINLGARTKGEWLFQKRIIFDFNPIIKNKWVRLRDNGYQVTIAIKEILDDSISGTRESEIKVDNFVESKNFLEDMGLKVRCYQENKRYEMDLDNVILDFDLWPQIPLLLELEGKNESDINRIIDMLKIDRSKVTSKGISAIYREFYGIELDNISNLIFNYNDSLNQLS